MRVFRVNVGSLCSGIGGFEIATDALGWRTAFVSEIDPHCSHWLAQHFPDVPNIGDFTAFDWSTVERPDIICAGWPCQPHSVAGKQRGSDDDRDLWPSVARCLRALRPCYFVGENVPGLFVSDGGRFFNRVMSDLAALGYDARWDVLSAAECGAPHKRERVWIVAHLDNANGGRCEQRDAHDGATAELGAGLASVGHPASGGRGAGPELPARRPDGGRQSVEYTDVSGPTRLGSHGWPELSEASVVAGGNDSVGNAVNTGSQRQCGDGDHGHQPGRLAPGTARPTAASRFRVLHPWSDAVAVRGADGTTRLIPKEAAEQGPESPLWPVADGVPGRVARLRAVGNAVVPAWVLAGPFKYILDRESSS